MDELFTCFVLSFAFSIHMYVAWKCVQWQFKSNRTYKVKPYFTFEWHSCKRPFIDARIVPRVDVDRRLCMIDFCSPRAR